MKTWRASSVVVATGRRIVRGSLVVHGSVTAVRLLTSHLAVFGSASASSVVMTWMPEFWRSEPDGVATVADGSRLLRACERFFERSVRGWRESSTSARVRTVLHPLPSLDAPRVRLAGWTAFSAATTHALFVGTETLSAHSAAGLGWAAAILFAFACMCRPEAVIVAWESSRCRGRARDRKPT